MSRIREYAVAGGTFAVALGIGFAMQNEDALAAMLGLEQSDPAPTAMAAATTPPAAPPTPEAEPVAAPAVQAAATTAMPEVMPAATPRQQAAAPSGPEAPDIAPDTGPARDEVIAASGSGFVPDLPALVAPVIRAAAFAADLPDRLGRPEMPELPVTLAALETDAPFDGLSTRESARAAPADCTPTLSAEVAPAAMVDLALAAPCAPSASVTIHHQGMTFSLLTDADGNAEVSVPALAETALFMAEIQGGGDAAASVEVTDMADYDRAVLQWEGGAEGMEIHALEFGAEYGEPGHVWRDAPRDPAEAVAGEGGFLVHLGAPGALVPRFAEVYTYPSGEGRRSGTVALTVETQVDADNCGREIAAQSIQVSPGTDPVGSDLTLAVPGCDAQGEYLVLSNMLQDLTLAAR